ncbi:LuxR C-terminal-related transcriptional regulator [Mycobacterium sp. E2699]|uniref:helix-turn-helix transcriptional regulator n=1 Tax=Mycobacterium sp. E2699 TaxID=1834137 RepID=UPI000B00E039|nr:LuxR C-terminal-related transcriptional regulator [Mycobacterium sp. E2699]
MHTIAQQLEVSIETVRSTLAVTGDPRPLRKRRPTPPCIVEGCERPRGSKTGHCRGHARQLRDNGTVTPFHSRLKQQQEGRRKREQAVFALRATGLTMQAIAAQLGISQTTVHRALCVTGDPCPQVFTGPKRCSIDGCERPSNYGPDGYCSTHEKRKKTGLPLVPELLRAPNGQNTPCVVKGCTRPRGNKDGYCNGHARQLKDTGAVTPSFQPRMKQPKFCNFDGCTGKAKSKGYCEAHLRQLRVHGHMVPIRTIFDECTYTGAHHRCRALWGRVHKYPCVWCGDLAEEWAYDGTDQSELYDTKQDWQLRSIVPYSRFPEFYMPMCKRCHKKLDMERLQAELRQFREWRKGERQMLGDDEPPF